jgi:uncharacterized membrane protein HdeD (DUF308 family)
MNIQNLAWKSLLIQGILAIVFGIAAIAWPSITIETLAIFTWIYFIIDGIVIFTSGMSAREEGQHWIAKVVLGVLEIAIGTHLIINPVTSIQVFAFMIGLLFFMRGTMEFAIAFSPQDAITGGSKAMLFIIGALSIFTGGVFIYYPDVTLYLFSLILGIYVIALGVSLLVLSYRVKRA